MVQPVEAEQGQEISRKRPSRYYTQRCWMQGTSSSEPELQTPADDCGPDSADGNTRRKKRRTALRHCVQGESSNAVQVPSVAEEVEICGTRRKRKRRTGRNSLLMQRDHTSYKLLKAATYCSKCGAMKIQYESAGFCCANGDVRVATNAMPAELLHFYHGMDSDSTHFQELSRFYNNFFAFSSLGGSFESDKFRGIYVFKMHGQAYHYLPNIIPHNECPRYLQLYFYDSQAERDIRNNVFSNLRSEIIDKLMTILLCNPYGRFFRSVGTTGVDEHTVLHINTNPVLDQRVFNAPTADEVAAIWSDRSASSSTGGPYVAVTGKCGGTHRIQHYYGCYDPLQYPLLFPYGDSGWHPGIPKVKKNDVRIQAPAIDVESAADAAALIAAEETRATPAKQSSKTDISCRQYYAYMLQIRPDNHILSGGRVFLQYIVDMYVKLENTRLDFLRNNQKLIRADVYQGVLDSIMMGHVEGESAGHRVILPPSFIGGPRDLKRRYLNAMTLVQKFGKPDIFATMTCNTNWPEITSQLREGELAQNRPDLVARIFRAKLMQAKKEMIDGELFGEVAAFIYVIEFQKRGLPHAHFLIILKGPSKIRSPEDYDKFVSAEIPPSSNEFLRATVLKHMMHGPCGEANKLCSCMKKVNGTVKCKSAYPKYFCEYTTTKDDGYPMYKRSDNGEVAKIRGHMLDNRWVIPYNPYLLGTFDCHFNVEVCSTIQAVKYLYKYVYKGHDRISYNIGASNSRLPVDEIEHYQNGRWVSPPEAVWRMFSFDLFEMVPPVMPLHVHCDKEQSLSFLPDEQLEDVVSDPRRLRTPLTEFFRMNAEHPERPKLLYVEFPQHYTWDDKARMWNVRKKGTMIGRLAFVGPADRDRFFLRKLLANVKAPTSYTYLKTVNGVVASTYQQACVARRLIEENNTADLCLAEAAQMQMPHTLRALFASLLVFCSPPNPRLLWDKYYDVLSEDYKNKFCGSEQTVLLHTAEDVQHLVENMGRDLAAYGLEHLKDLQNEEIRLTRDISDVLNAPIPEEYMLARSKLNSLQQKAFDAVMHHVNSNIPGLFFIDGPGGTGKTFLYGALYAEIRSMDKIVLPTASSGIAASCLPSGRTAHSRFKLPLDHDVSLSCNVPKQGSLAKLLRQTTLIIWDEAPMANKDSIHALDLLLQDVCDSSALFGGKIVVFGGDFRQVLPVVPHKSQKEAVEASLVCSHLWPHFRRFVLSENMRARDDPQFADFLLAMGDGKLQHTEVATMPLPQTINMVEIHSDGSMNELLGFFNTQLDGASTVAVDYSEKAILSPRNDEVDLINNFFIEHFPGEPTIYKSYDQLLDEQCNLYPTEFLNGLCPGGMSPHELILKKDCPVMLLRNTNPGNGRCNGTRLICKKFFEHTILCAIATGYYKGQHVFIHTIKFRPAASSRFPFRFERKQFPIKLCFAMTVNKSQGQTLNEVGIYLRQPCFSHGQLYVALSRARSAAKVKVFVTGASKNESGRHVRNVVSYEVLEKAGSLYSTKEETAREALHIKANLCNLPYFFYIRKVMKPHYKPLKEINDTTKFYKCKVKVFHKGHPQHSPNKTRYQRVILKDDEGFTMKATLFGSDIDAYAEALQRNGEYEISNAIVKPVPSEHSNRPNEYTMTINKNADIVPLIKDQALFAPQYQTISSVPQSSDADFLFDIVAVVLHITEPRKVQRTDRNANSVTEIYITDASCDRPYMISTWDDLSDMCPKLLSTWSEGYVVVGFTALKTKSYKGFTFTTSMSTDILMTATGKIADSLRAWTVENLSTLDSMRAKLRKILCTDADAQPITIEKLKKRMAHDTWQEERFVLTGMMPYASTENLRMYIGCSSCGKSLPYEIETVVTCTHCLSKNVTCIPRATLKAEIVDDTGSLELIFYTKEIELLTGTECSNLWAAKDDAAQLTAHLDAVQAVSFQVHVGPTLALSKSRILTWAVRSVVLISSKPN